MRGRDYILVKIQKLEEEADLSAGRNYHNRARKRRVSTSEISAKQPYPPQRIVHLGLFFRPANGPVSVSVSAVPVAFPLNRRRILRSSKAKDEIEDLLSTVEKEISDLAISTASARSHRKKRRKKLEKPETMCQLAVSTQLLSSTRIPERRVTDISHAFPNNVEELAKKLRRKTVGGRKQNSSVSVSFGL